MILLNITFSVDRNISGEFLDFIHSEIIPAAKSERFHGFILSKVRVEDQENFLTGKLSSSYAIQMIADTEGMVVDWMKGPMVRFNSVMAQKWGPSIGYFETVLDIIDSEE